MTVHDQLAHDLCCRDQDRLSFRDQHRAAALAAVILVGAIIFSFKFTSFLHAKEAVVYLGIVLLASLASRGRVMLQGIFDFAPLWLWLLVATGHAALGRVQVPGDAYTEVLRWTLLLLAVAAVYDTLPHPRVRAMLTGAIQLAAFLVALLGLLQYAGLASALFPEFPQYTQRVYSVFGNQDLFGGYIAIALPLPLLTLGDTRGRTRMLNLALFAILLLALLLSASRSAWLAGAAGIGLAILPRFKTSPQRFRRSVAPAVVAALVITAAVLYAPEATVARLRHTVQPHDEGRNARIACWQAGWRLFTQHPALGIGLGGFAYCSPATLGDLAAQSQRPPGYAIECHADHPHSEPVRFLTETGVFGFLCLCWMIVRIARAGGPEIPSLAAIGVFALFNGAFLSVAHLLPALILAGLALSRTPLPMPSSRILARILPLLTAASAACIASTVILPSYRLQAAQDALAEGKPAIALFKAAVEAAPNHVETHKEYGIALAAQGRDEEARRQLVKALDGADTGDIYLALATVAARQKDYPAARRFAQECLHRWPANEDIKTLLSALAIEEDTDGGA